MLKIAVYPPEGPAAGLHRDPPPVYWGGLIEEDGGGWPTHIRTGTSEDEVHARVRAAVDRQLRYGGLPHLMLLPDGGCAVLSYVDGWLVSIKHDGIGGRTLHRLDHGGEMSPAEAIAETKRIVRRFEDGEPQ